MNRSMLLALCLLIVGVINSQGQQPCLSICGQYRVTDALTRAHLETAPFIIVDHAGSPPIWWDPTWLEHLIVAGNAFSAVDMSVTYMHGGSQNIEVILVGHQDFWPGGTPVDALAATEVFLGNGYVYEKRVWVNLFYYSDVHWNEESLAVPLYPAFDLATVLLHEFGHAFGYQEMPNGLEYCTVMTGAVPTEVARSLRSWDIDGLICYYPIVSVGDIQSFDVSGSGHNANLSFEIQGGANPNEYAAVYVSDNPDGPARLIDVLTAHANLMPATNSWVDSYRLPPAGTYYYWLDYNSFPPVDFLRSPVGLYPGGSASVSGTGGVSFDPPDITAVADVPFDLGGRVIINWQASTDEANIDYYNIYRNSYPPGHPEQGEWKYLLSVNPGVTSHVDELLTTGWTNQYKVSAAHHGNYTLQSGRGNRGIWNATSSPVSGIAINNFSTDQISLVSNDTLVVCPGGNVEALQAEIVIWGSQIGPTPGIPPQMLECLPQNNAFFCVGEPLIADGPTDAQGRTYLTESAIGGSGRTDLVFKVADLPGYPPTFLDTLVVYLKSPDVNGDGEVGIVDLADFVSGGGYQSPPNPYKWRHDYNGDGQNNIADYSFLVNHYEHECDGGGQGSPVAQVSYGATIQIHLTEVVSAGESRVLYADISVSGLLPFKVLAFHLRSDNPTLVFEYWERGRFQGQVLVAPIVRDGIGEIAMCVLDGENLEGSTIELGRLVFRIESRDVLQLGERDFETRVAETLSSDGVVSRLSTATSSEARPIERIVGDALAQNRPNPFNPTTTISYSISQPGHVELLVFGVDGSLVRTLVNRDQSSDRYDVIWDGSDNRGQRASSGVYFYQLKAPRHSETKKMVLLK